MLGFLKTNRVYEITWPVWIVFQNPILCDFFIQTNKLVMARQADSGYSDEIPNWTQFPDMACIHTLWVCVYMPCQETIRNACVYSKRLNVLEVKHELRLTVKTILYCSCKFVQDTHICHICWRKSHFFSIFQGNECIPLVSHLHIFFVIFLFSSQINNWSKTASCSLLRPRKNTKNKFYTRNFV